MFFSQGDTVWLWNLKQSSWKASMTTATFFMITNPLHILDQDLFRNFGSFEITFLLNVTDVAREIHVYLATIAWRIYQLLTTLN